MTIFRRRGMIPVPLHDYGGERGEGLFVRYHRITKGTSSCFIIGILLLQRSPPRFQLRQSSGIIPIEPESLDGIPIAQGQPPLPRQGNTSCRFFKVAPYRGSLWNSLLVGLYWYRYLEYSNFALLSTGKDCLNLMNVHPPDSKNPSLLYCKVSYKRGAVFGFGRSRGDAAPSGTMQKRIFSP